MAKYAVFGIATLASAYFGYKYIKIYGPKLQQYISNLLQTLDETSSSLLKIEQRLSTLEQNYNKIKNETDISRSFANGESFSLLSAEDEVVPPEKENEPAKPSDPYIADVLKGISNVRKEALELEERVRYYKGSAGDRVYKHFNEKIIRLLISLDRIDTKGHSSVKEMKNDAVEYLKGIQAVLKSR